MGLLDDAIREHLELKRRRGADPGEIAHQERAALNPVISGEPEAIEGEPDDALELTDAAQAAPATDEETGLSDAVAGTSELEDPSSTVAHPGQETAELDMEEVLAADPHAGRQEQAPAAPPATQEPGRADDSLEWEIPRRAGQEPSTEETPGQERMNFE